MAKETKETKAEETPLEETKEQKIIAQKNENKKNDVILKHNFIQHSCKLGFVFGGETKNLDLIEGKVSINKENNFEMIQYLIEKEGFIVVNEYNPTKTIHAEVKPIKAWIFRIPFTSDENLQDGHIGIRVNGGDVQLKYKANRIKIDKEDIAFALTNEGFALVAKEY